MDLQAHNLIGTPSPRWAKVLAFCCFALTCGFLMGSLTGSLKVEAAGAPPAAGATERAG